MGIVVVGQGSYGADNDQRREFVEDGADTEDEPHTPSAWRDRLPPTAPE
jgi:hypothetical protein